MTTFATIRIEPLLYQDICFDKSDHTVSRLRLFYCTFCGRHQSLTKDVTFYRHHIKSLALLTRLLGHAEELRAILQAQQTWKAFLHQDIQTLYQRCCWSPAPDLPVQKLRVYCNVPALSGTCRQCSEAFQ
jgi:hypothetical protein